MKGVNAKVHIMESGKRGWREDRGKKYRRKKYRHTHTPTHTLVGNLKYPQLITAHLWTQQSRTQP